MKILAERIAGEQPDQAQTGSQDIFRALDKNLIALGYRADNGVFIWRGQHIEIDPAYYCADLSQLNLHIQSKIQDLLKAGGTSPLPVIFDEPLDYSLQQAA